MIAIPAGRAATVAEKTSGGTSTTTGMPTTSNSQKRLKKNIIKQRAGKQTTVPSNLITGASSSSNINHPIGAILTGSSSTNQQILQFSRGLNNKLAS